MSHFSVLVAAYDEEDLRDKLMPYHEYGWGMDCDGEDKPYLQFKIEHEAANFEQDAVAILDGLDADSELRPKYEQYIEASNYAALFENWDGGEQHPETGDWGYWHNPNAKWDWYAIGGRMTGLLLLKPSIGYVTCPYCGYSQDLPEGVHRCGQCNGALDISNYIPAEDVKEETGNGKPGLMTKPNLNPRRCDYAPSGFVDWDAISTKQLSNRMNTYRAYHECLAEAHTIISNDNDYEAVIQKAQETFDNEGDRGEYCRAAFYSAKDYALARITDSLLHKRDAYLFNTFQEDADLFYKTEQEYRDMFAGDALTYAFIDTEGKWHQRGEMGWFGCDDKEKGTPDYDEAFWQFVRALSPEQRVYVVDCHI
jgi:hypothetical protein